MCYINTARLHQKMLVSHSLVLLFPLDLNKTHTHTPSHLESHTHRILLCTYPAIKADRNTQCDIYTLLYHVSIYTNVERTHLEHVYVKV